MGHGTRRGHRHTVDDRTLTLTNLDKVLYPSVGFTKAEVIDYYLRIAPVMLPHPRPGDDETAVSRRCRCRQALSMRRTRRWARPTGYAG